MTKPNTVHVEARNYGRRLDISFLVLDRAGGKKDRFARIVWEELSDDSAIDEASASLDRTAAQSLMDQLWAVGLRPAESQYTAEAQKATQQHLQDMRELAFGALRKAGALQGTKKEPR